MADKVFTGPGNFSDNTKWDGSALPSAGDNLQITTGTCTLTANETNVYGALVIDASITLDLATYNLSVGAATINGILKIGVSAGTGFTAAGITVSSGGTMNLQTTSKINNSGNFTVPNEVWKTLYTGDYTQSGNGNYIANSTAGYWYNFTLDVGVTITITGQSVITGSSSNNTTINGTINFNGQNAYLGISTTGVFTIGVNGNFSGGGGLFLNAFEGTFANNRMTAFSFTGGIANSASIGNNLCMPAWDFSNGNVTITGGNTPGLIRKILAGTLKCKAFTVTPSGVNTTTIDCSANPSFEFSGAVDTQSTATVVTWNKGTGTITLIGGNANVDFNGHSVEGLVVNCSGSKTIQNNFSCTSFSMSAGTFVDNGKAITVIGAITISGGTFTSTGTWTLGAATAAIDFGGKTVNAINVDCSGFTKTLSSHLTTGAFTLTAGTINLNGKNLTATSIDLKGGTFTAGSGTVGTGELKRSAGTITLNANSATFNISGDMDLTGVSWQTGTETVNLSGTSKTLTTDGSKTIATLNVAGTRTLAGDLQASGTGTVSGTLTISGSSVFINGTIAGSGTLISGDATTKTVYWRNANSFAGVLTRIILEEHGGPGWPKPYYGLSINTPLKVKVTP